MPKPPPKPSNRSTPYGRKCFLCNNTRHKDKNCRLFRFPARGTPMWERWLEALGLTDADMDTRANASARLCQLHFQPKDFLTRQLSGMAVPVPSVECVQAIDADDGAAAETLFGSSFEYILDDPIDEDSHRDAFEELEEVYLDDHHGSTADESESHRENDELIENKEPESPNHIRCDVPQHRDLEEELGKARALIVQLQKQNDYQKRLIQEQKNLLSSLGVQCVIRDESYGESPE